VKHCTIETLARLVDALPDPESRAHLERCATCRSQLNALRQQRQSLADLPFPAVPAHLWPRIAAELARDSGSSLRIAANDGFVPRWRSTAWMRVAAVVIFLAGGASGSVVTRTMFASTSEKGGATEVDIVSSNPMTENSMDVSNSVDELARYLGDMPDSLQRDLVLRLSALEAVVSTTALAIRQAPGDPTLAAYHAAALNRRALLWQEVARGSGERWY